MWERVILVVVAALVTGIRASEVSDAVARLPGCATQCVANAIPQIVGCTPDDRGCLCASDHLANNLMGCVKMSCSVKNLLSSIRVYTETCQIPPSTVPEGFSATHWTLGAFCFACIIFRLLSRVLVAPNGKSWHPRHYMTLEELGWDDLFIGLAFPLIVGCFYSEIEMLYGRYGLGSDMWMLAPEQITGIGLWFFIGGTMYYVAMLLVRASLICFFMRVFCCSRGTAIDQTCLGPLGLKLRHALIGSLVFNLAYFSITEGILLGLCHPISYYWDGWDGEHQGSCLDNHAFAESMTILGILFDTWLLYLPLSQIPGLNLTPWRKVGILAILSLGLFSVIISCIRLSTMKKFANSPNGTKDNFDTAVWSTVDLWAAATCACLPSLRILFARKLPCVLAHVLRRCNLMPPPTCDDRDLGARRDLESGNEPEELTTFPSSRGDGQIGGSRRVASGGKMEVVDVYEVKSGEGSR